MQAGEDVDLPAAAYWLGYGALLPFVAGALVMLAVPEAATRELAGRALLAYGAIILSLQGGAHWRFVLRAAPARTARALAFAVLPSLAGWAALLLPFEKAAAVQVAAFGGFWLYEHRVLGPAVVPPAYLALRRSLTLGVIASLGLALMAPALVPTHF